MQIPSETASRAIWTAVGAMTAASALIAMTSLLAKTLGTGALGTDGLHPFQVSAGRYAFGLLALMTFTALRRRPRPDIAGAHWRLHLLRTCFGWTGVTCMFAAAARMPLADATAISFLSPLVTMGLAVLLLGESITLRKVLAGLLALAGALLILRPGTSAFQPAGLIALAAACFMALEIIFLKRLSGLEPPLRILLINNTIGAAISLSAAAFVWQAPAASQWAQLAALGGVMVIAQSLFIQAMKRGAASVVMPTFYSALIFAAFYDFLIFAVLPSLLAVAGAALIVIGALLVALAAPDPPEPLELKRRGIGRR